MSGTPRAEKRSGWTWFGAAWFFAAVSLWGDWARAGGLDGAPWQAGMIALALAVFLVLNVVTTLFPARRRTAGVVALAASVTTAGVLISAVEAVGGVGGLGWGFWVALPVPVCGAIGGLAALLADMHRGDGTPLAEGPRPPLSP